MSDRRIGTPTERRRAQRELNHAHAEAKRRWGKTAHVEDRIVHHPPLAPRYSVGQITLGLFFSVYGSGATWEEAFANAAVHDHSDYRDCCQPHHCAEKQRLVEEAQAHHDADPIGLAAIGRQREAIQRRIAVEVNGRVPAGWGAELAARHAAEIDWCQCSACRAVAAEARRAALAAKSP